MNNKIQISDSNRDGLRVRVGFCPTDRFGNGNYTIRIFDELNHEVMSGFSKPSKEGYFRDNNKAIDAAEALAEKLGIALDLNEFFRFDDSSGTVPVYAENNEFPWDAIYGALLLLLAVLGMGWILWNIFNGTSTLV